jgi:molybdenum cofactor cytidylyltransferase
MSQGGRGRASSYGERSYQLVGGVLLAAGRSSRFGAGLPKQLVDWEGEPLVRRAARAAIAAGVTELVAVLGHRADAVRAALAGLAVRPVLNRDFAEGKASSIRAGVASLSPQVTAAVFLPCDQPHLSSEVLIGLLEAFRLTGQPIVVPAFEGRRGAPTLFARRFFPELAELKGEDGGREIVQRYPELVVELELESELPLLDADTPADLERLGRAIGGR